MLPTKSAGCLLAAIALSSVILQGCGGGAKTTTKPPTTTPAAGSSTTSADYTTTHKPSTSTPAGGSTTTPAGGSTTTSAGHKATTKPMTVKEAVEYYNELFFALGEGKEENFPPSADDTSRMGITISYAANANTFSGNLFCAPLMNTSCHSGFADCRMSAALINWKMGQDNYVLKSTMNRIAGYIFNQTMVENLFGKCFYPFDGTDFNRVNHGCGESVSASTDCKDKKSAFWNICPSTGKECTAKDPEVKGQMCPPEGGEKCFWSGPALNFPHFDQPSDLRKMVNYRAKKMKETGDYKSWNEVVIEEMSLIPEIRKDPAAAIPALVVTKSSGSAGLRILQQMQAEFSRFFKFDEKIPIIMVDDNEQFCVGGDCSKRHGPFFDPETTGGDNVEIQI